MVIAGRHSSADCDMEVATEAAAAKARCRSVAVGPARLLRASASPVPGEHMDVRTARPTEKAQN
jgi:hypothetical protein